MSEVPTIDLSQVDDRSLELIDRACRDHGFFLAVGHGMDGHLAALMDKAKAFFDLPKEEKRKVLRTADNPMGYFDRELTKQKRDQKEVFDFYAPRAGAGIGRMRWPEQPEGFREVLSDYFHASAGVAKLVMALLCRAIGQPASVLDEAFSGSPTNTARLNHYPPEDLLSVDERKDVKPLGDMALHHHTDPGAVTLLYQDQVGGLETYSREDGWIPVPPNPDALVVNVGDVVQVWSNGQYRAATYGDAGPFDPAQLDTLFGSLRQFTTRTFDRSTRRDFIPRLVDTRFLKPN